MTWLTTHYKRRSMRNRRPHNFGLAGGDESATRTIHTIEAIMQSYREKVSEETDEAKITEAQHSVIGRMKALLGASVDERMDVVLSRGKSNIEDMKKHIKKELINSIKTGGDPEAMKDLKATLNAMKKELEAVKSRAEALEDKTDASDFAIRKMTQGEAQAKAQGSDAVVVMDKVADEALAATIDALKDDVSGMKSQMTGMESQLKQVLTALEGLKPAKNDEAPAQDTPKEVVAAPKEEAAEAPAENTRTTDEFGRKL